MRDAMSEIVTVPEREKKVSVQRARSQRSSPSINYSSCTHNISHINKKRSYAYDDAINIRGESETFYILLSICCGRFAAYC